MDARNTGALIAARRKALGLTQKQLAERLLVSDKAVSKWEVGASYPEVTLLPPLAQVLGLTVDELLAGEAQQEQAADNADAAAPQDAPPADGGRPHDKTAAFSPEAFLPPQDYLADRLGGTDDKFLLAAAVCILAAVYCGRPYGWLAAVRNLVIILVVYIAFRVWHGKQRGRFAALGLDTAVSRRRALLADRLFGTVWAVVLLCALYFTVLYAMLGTENELAKIGRYHVVLDMTEIHVTGEAAWFGGWYVLASVPLCLALVGLYALAYRRMTKETRFRPLAVALPVLPALAGAAVVGWQRVQTALAHMPDYGEALSTVSERAALEQALATAGQGAQTGAAIAAAVLVAALLVLWRVGRRVSLVSAILLAVYALIWLPSSTLWLDIGYEDFINAGSTEDITIQLVGLMILLALTVLCAGIALFADSLRRQKA